MKSIASLSTSITRKIDAIIHEVEQAEKKTVEQARSMFVKRSSGTMTPGQRRLLGYPYSRRRPSGAVDPSYINVGTGDLRRSWVAAYPKIIGGIMKSSVKNTSKDAMYMFGTGRMVARRIDTAVAALIQSNRMTNLRKAIQKGLRA